MDTKEPTKEERVLSGINLILSLHDLEPRYAIEYFIEYVSFIAEQINYNRLALDVKLETILSFEGASMAIIDILARSGYPDSIQKRVNEIMNQCDILNFFIVMATISRSDMIQITTFNTHSFLGRLLRSSLPERLSKLNLSEERFITVKGGLHRLTSVLRYATSYEPTLFNKEQFDFGDYFNEAAIQRPEVLNLLFDLKRAINQLPSNSDVKEILEKNTNCIISQMNARQPPWGRIFAALILMLGITSDLKSVFPDTYSNTHKAIVDVLSKIRSDANVRQTTQHAKRLPANGDYYQLDEVAMLPRRPHLDDENSEDES